MTLDTFRSYTLLLACAALLHACSPMGTVVQRGVRSHGPSIHGYGPISFNMPRENAVSALQGKGRWENVAGEDAHALTYYDYLGYLNVKVMQHFSHENKAAKAEVIVLGAQETARSLSECRGLQNTVYGMLRQRYQEPDWPPRVTTRRYGESGIGMYTFADSSFIKLTYDYVTRHQDGGNVGLCTVKLSFNPPWA